MTGPRYAELAARVLSSGTHAEPQAPSAQARAQAVVALTAALERRRLRRRTRRVAGVGFAAAAAAAAVAFVAFRPDTAAPIATVPAPTTVPAPLATPLTLVSNPRGAGGTVEANGQERPLLEGSLLNKGSRIVTRAAGGATVALSTGTKLVLDESAQLAVEADGDSQVFALAAGAVEAQVAKLSGSQRFLVRTTDAEIEVRGTAFRVSRVAGVASCGGGTTTRVAVSEGVVIVRHRNEEVRVTAGESWPHCEAAPERPSTATRTPNARERDPLGPLTPAASASQLAEQNDMFARAMGARRAGKASDAVARFDELLGKYPRTPLAESATVERMRTLRTFDAARARIAARDYLARYPKGFARTEANEILEAAQ